MGKEPKKVYVFSPDTTLRINAQHVPGDRFLLIINQKKKQYLFLTLNSDRLLVADNGTEFMCEDETLMRDLDDRAGIGIFSLPKTGWYQPAAKVHDVMTSCMAWQLAHTRSSSEKHFKNLLDGLSDNFIEEVEEEALSLISRIASWFYWDVKETRWK